VPRTIEEAVRECHERRDRELTVKVAATLADALEHARKDKVAEAKYGPIVDNPEYYRAIKSPMSGLDLLRNVKWAIDHDALLRIDFFTSENMKRFFGVSAVVFREIAAGESKWRSPMRRANPQTGCLYQVELSWIGDAQSASLTVDCNSSHEPLAKTGSLTPKYRRKGCIFGVYPPKGRLRVFTGRRRPGRRAMIT
jgi:hypothetical protein